MIINDFHREYPMSCRFSKIALWVALPLGALTALQPADAARLSDSCQVQGAVGSEVGGVFSSYPSGGPGMVDGVAMAVARDADKCQDVVAATQGAGSAAISSAGDGLAGAYSSLSKSDAAGTGKIMSCMRCASPELQASFAYARTIRATSTVFGQAFSPGSGAGGVVSPSRP